MAITTTDIKFLLTGGASNTDPNSSLGGAISSTEISSGSLHNLFDKVTGDEAITGTIEYRCIGVKNDNALIDWEAVKVYITSNTIGGDSIDIGVEKPSDSAVQTITNETTAPSAISFSAPSTRAAGLTCTSQTGGSGVVVSKEWVGVWLRRTVPQGCPAKDNNSVTIEVSGDTSE